MRQAVRDAFYDFSTPFEGAVGFLYQDVRGLVSIGVGILADPLGLALSLPLKRSDGSLASPAEIKAEWQTVKNLGSGDAYDKPANPAAKGGHLYSKRYTSLRLDDAGLRSTLATKADLFDRQLRQRFPNWEEWPADAQLAIMSLTWACGAAFRFPKLERALRTLDFLTASTEVDIDDSKNPGVTPRNRANRMLLSNASVVEAQQMDPDVLYYPRDLENEPPDAA